MNTAFTLFRQRLARLYGEGEARAVAFLVFEEAFGISRTEIYVGKGRQFSEDERERLLNISSRLEAGEPVQYVLGHTWFCGRKFEVSPAVLIPRPETEELVEWAVRTLGEAGFAADDPAASPRVLDAGTGSGCIAVSIGLAHPSAEVEAWDLSAEALGVAQANASRLGAAVSFRRQDLLAAAWPAGEPFDLVVSNPPYICQAEQAEMERHVLDFEPHGALFVPDADPLLFYRALAQRAAGGALRPGGFLLVEVNRAYAQATAELFDAEGFRSVEVRRDDFGNERMVRGRL